MKIFNNFANYTEYRYGFYLKLLWHSTEGLFPVLNATVSVDLVHPELNEQFLTKETYILFRVAKLKSLKC